MKKLFLIAVVLTICLIGGVVSAETTTQAAVTCHIPDSGPWPPCATGQGSAASDDSCVIPDSGPWPACAAATPPNVISEGGDTCEIPASGPWPPCATGGATSGGTPEDSCQIPPSGPWPACAASNGATQPPAPVATPTESSEPPVSTAATVETTDWSVDYFTNSAFLGEPQAQETLAAGVNGRLVKDWGVGAPFAGISADKFSARLQTTITAPDNSAGRVQTFRIQLNSDNPHTHLYVSTQGARNGHAAHQMRATTRGDNTSNLLALCAGEQVKITIEYIDLEAAANVSFALTPQANESDMRCRVSADNQVDYWRGDTGTMQIKQLSAWVDGYDVTPQWEVLGATQIGISAGYGNFYDANANAVINNAPAAGTVVFDIGKILPFKPQLRLSALAANGAEIERSIPINLTCRVRWFFEGQSTWSQLGIPGTCGDRSVNRAAVFQPFENGFMLLLAVDETESLVIAGTADGQVRQFDNYQFDQLESVPAGHLADSGLFSANGAIGQIWFYYGMSDQLGWATEPATSYTAIMQSGYTDFPHFDAIELPNKQVLIVNRGPGAPENDGSVNWRVVTP